MAKASVAVENLDDFGKAKVVDVSAVAGGACASHQNGGFRHDPPPDQLERELAPDWGRVKTL
jgi:hypothetical protein